MAKSNRRAAAGRALPERLKKVANGQRVVIDGFGAGTVIAVERRRGLHYADAWVRPDEDPDIELGVRYNQGIYAEPVAS
jgi:hypothetical protein